MSVPSLLVLFVSGWQVGPSPLEPLLQGPEPFLETLIDAFPVLGLRPASDNLFSVYKGLGQWSGADGQKQSLAALLDAQRLSQVRIGDMDRFGLITETLDAETIASEREQWVYVPLPSGPLNAAALETQVTAMQQACEQQLERRKDTVVFAGFSQLWTASTLAEAPTALPAVMAHLSSSLTALTMSAVDKGWRVILCPDAPLSHVGAQLDASTVWPVIFAHTAVEGRKASAADVYGAADLRLRPQFSFESLPVTIGLAAGITAPSPVRPLFADLLPLTMTA